MNIRELLEADVIKFPRKFRRDPLDMVHRSLFERDLPNEPAEPAYRNGVSVARTPQGFTVFINGEEYATYDDPERAHEEAAELQITLDDEAQ
jgi:hypothetical protein